MVDLTAGEQVQPLQIQDDLELLDLMLADQENASAIYLQTDFWKLQKQSVVEHLKDKGLHDLRRQNEGEFIGFVPVDPCYARSAMKTVGSVSNLSDEQKDALHFFIKIAGQNPDLAILPFGLSVCDLELLAFQSASYFGLGNLARLPSDGEDSCLGNPFHPFVVNGKVYTYEWLRYYYIYAHFSQFIDFDQIDNVVEIGPGLGLQAEVLKKLHPHLNMYLLDTTPQSYICHQFISGIFPETTIDYRVLRERETITLENGEIAVLSNWQMNKVAPVGRTLFWSSGVLCSVDSQCLSSYFDFIVSHADVVALMEHMEGIRNISVEQEEQSEKMDADAIARRLMENRFSVVGRAPLRTPLNLVKDSAGFVENICAVREDSAAKEKFLRLLSSVFRIRRQGMEFTDLSRYLKVHNPKVPPFSDLRTMPPVRFSQDLDLLEEDENIVYANNLAGQGMAVVPVQRVVADSGYINRDSFPRRILFEMTSRCNFRCRMCPQQNLQRPRMDMPGALYRKILDEIDTYGVEGLWLYHLGESLLHPEFHENLAHVAKKQNLGVVWMSTNGQLFTEDVARAVLASGIDFLNFSMHAVTEKTYNSVAPQGNFATVMGNLETWYALKGTKDLPRKPFLHCQMIEQETTRHEVDAFIAAHFKRADVVSVNMLEYVNIAGNAFGLDQRKRNPLNSCLRVSRNDCFICSNGHVTLCDAAYNGELYLGNINEQSLYDIWNGTERRRILELNQQGRMGEIEFCSHCTDYDI